MKKLWLISPLLLLLVSCGPNKLPEPTIEHTIAKAGAIATLNLVAFNGDSERIPGTLNFGHAFVIIENTSAAVLAIGDFSLEPNEYVSIGSWSFSTHFGLWYNLETTYIKELNRYQGRLSLPNEMVVADITKLNDYLDEHDYWSLTKNCSFMALDMYNLIANEQVSVPGIVTPQKIYDKIKYIKGREENLAVGATGLIGYGQDGKFVEYKLKR